MAATFIVEKNVIVYELRIQNFKILKYRVTQSCLNKEYQCTLFLLYHIGAGTVF